MGLGNLLNGGSSRGGAYGFRLGLLRSEQLGFTRQGTRAWDAPRDQDTVVPVRARPRPQR